MRCPICCTRYKPKDGSRKYCWLCNQRVQATLAVQKKAQHSRPSYFPQYLKVLYWKGHLVGMRPKQALERGESLKTLTYQTPLVPVWISYYQDESELPKRLPKSKLLNLNRWVDGLDKRQVKNLKNAIRSVAPCPPLKHK